MEMREFGHTGMRLSVLGFGCGAVGGLMVRGAPADQDRAINEALNAGINYFDTAVQYGDGVSETNLGRVLDGKKRDSVHVGTKVRIPATEFGRIAEVVTASLDASLRRLAMDRVDIFHLHNPITVGGGGESLSVAQVKQQVVPAFQALRQAGKTRFLGITAVGDTDALHQVIDSGAFDSAQVSYNMLNPSAATALPPNYPAQDYDHLFDHTTKAGVGVVGIRVLAAGALSGTAERHPTASPPPAPIGSAHSYDTGSRPRSPSAAPGQRWFRVQPGRGGDSFRYHAPGHGYHLGRHGHGRGIRRQPGRGAERPVAASRIGSACRVDGQLRRRATLRRGLPPAGLSHPASSGNRQIPPTDRPGWRVRPACGDREPAWRIRHVRRCRARFRTCNVRSVVFRT